MRYVRPQLHRLNDLATSVGNCGSGSVANSRTLQCQIGTGDVGLGYCLSGTGAGNGCSTGAAAGLTAEPGWCYTGTSPLTSCSMGGSPV